MSINQHFTFPTTDRWPSWIYWIEYWPKRGARHDLDLEAPM